VEALVCVSVCFLTKTTANLDPVQWAILS